MKSQTYLCEITVGNKESSLDCVLKVKKVNQHKTDYIPMDKREVASRIRKTRLITT